MDRPDTPPSLPAGTVIGQYVIEERIGAGGFGEVFRAKDSVIEREVALKILHAKYSSDAEAIARVLDEARAVNQISHPGIVDIFGFDTFTGRALIVMELIEGTLLRDLLRERGRLPLAEALPILRGIAEAVDAAHAASIAHRDLKPDNVFVLAGGRTKLIDFGLAKLLRETEPVTQSGSIFGTPLYMSPEQCRGGKIDTRTDLYSFGALAYHVLVGEPPFGGEPIELALHHVNDRPEAPSKRRSELSRNVDRVVLALLAKDPAERPASLVAAVDALAGAARLRVRSKRVKYAALAAIPIALAGLGIAKLATRETPVVESDCVAAADKVAPLWNETVRDALAKRFASDRADVRHAWKLTADGLDAAVGRWSVQWDAACRAPERTTEPMLYGQRIACLETALVSLKGWTDTLSTTDVITYGETASAYVDLGTGGRSLLDCSNTAALRAQVPPPPAAVRPRIAALLAAADRVLERGWAAQVKRDVPAVDRAAAELDKVVREIETLDAASAADGILRHSELVVAVAWDKDLNRLPAARTGVLDAIKRIEASRDDVALALAYLQLAGIEMASLHHPSAIDRALGAVDRAGQAVTRAGHPIYPSIYLASARGALAIARGRFAEAADAYRDAVRLAKTTTTDPAPFEAALVTALLRGERPTEARDVARGFLQRIDDRFGPNHALSSWPYGLLANVHESAGEADAAVTARRRAAEDYATNTTSPRDRSTWGTAYGVELDLRLGRTSVNEAVKLLRDLANLGTVPRGHNPDGLATARRAGLFAAFAFGAGRTDIVGEAERLDHLATLAFHRGDLADMAKHVAASEAHCAKPGACGSWIRFSRWLAVLADARAARTDIDARLAALEREYAIPSARAYSGIVLASLGRWTDALPKLEAARGESIWEMQADLADLDTWLGLARLRAGEIAAARTAFEEALRVIAFDRNGIEGFAYTTPVAQLTLATILWEAKDGERHRARKLAERSRDGFERLGVHLKEDRDRAVRWLAEHPL